MNAPPANHPPQPTLNPAADPSLGKLGIGCLVGSVLIVILIFVFGAIGFRAGNRYVLVADPVARQFLQAIRTNHPDDAYTLGSEEWKHKTSPADLKEMIRQWQAFTGETESITLTRNSWSTEAQETRVSLTYNVHGSKHPMLVTMVLVSDGGPYKLVSYNYEKGPSLD